MMKSGVWGFGVSSSANNSILPGDSGWAITNDHINGISNRDENKTENTNNNNVKYGLNLSYDLNKKHLFNLSCSLGNMESDLKANSFNTTTALNNNELLRTYSRISNAQSNKNNYFIDADYQYVFKPDTSRKIESSLSIAYRYANNASESDSKFNVAGNTTMLGNQNTNDENNGEYTVQADYTFKQKRKGEFTFETGIKTVVRDNVSYKSVYPEQFNSGEFELQPTSNYSFGYNQQVYSGYVSLSESFKKLVISIGSRIEYSRGQGISKANNDLQVPFSTSNFYLMPVFNLSYLANWSNRISFSYRMNGRKPAFDMLNPAVTKFNEWTVRYGNPELKPEKAHSFKTEYTYLGPKGLNLSFALEHEFCNNALEDFYWVNTDSITHRSYANSATSKSLGLAFNVNKSFLNQKLRFSFNVMPRKVWSNYKSKHISIEDFSTGYGGSVSYSFSKGPSISSSLFSNGAMVLGQLKVAGYTSHSFDISQSFFERKLSFTASVTSPFQKQRIDEALLMSPEFEQSSYRSSQMRSFTLRLNYNFRKNSILSRQNTKKIVNDDLK
ncbi:outer membrane beta-barrel family protein [Solitalea koreensis]|uniref:Outer membrane protein beta-barrel family protein n=1 Tax=Solitalea koreensis TaxID=543615 RepID=A0A521E6Z2_9SPHI|nr:outer membrane beta-barrel family protein [Solitalea koreensis]SMO79632.1 Outer membrane protein beta-barrel family protein [Solitalea koreensis]